MVPTTMTRMTASITAYSAISSPSSSNQILRRSSFIVLSIVVVRLADRCAGGGGRGRGVSADTYKTARGLPFSRRHNSRFPNDLAVELACCGENFCAEYCRHGQQPAPGWLWVGCERS